MTYAIAKSKLLSQRTDIAVSLRGAVEPRAPVVHRAAGAEPLSVGADGVAMPLIPDQVSAREGVSSIALLPDQDVQCDPSQRKAPPYITLVAGVLTSRSHTSFSGPKGTLGDAPAGHAPLSAAVQSGLKAITFTVSGRDGLNSLLCQIAASRI